MALLAAAGLWYCRPIRRWAQLLGISLAALYFSSLPLTAALLARTLQPSQPADMGALLALENDTSAIVVLAGGLHDYAPEYQGETLHTRTLGRLRYGALLARQSRLPMLLSGGAQSPHNASANAPREAALMAKTLAEEFGMTPRWVEAASQNTRENAQKSAELLRNEGVTHIVLVTQALHMRRATEAFHAQHFHILAAPTLFANERLDLHRLSSWLPSPSAMAVVRYACHEWLGIGFYRLTQPRDIQESS